MRSAICLGVLFLAGAIAQADVVKLKNGKTFDCKVRGYGKTKLIVEADGATQELRITSVESFQIGVAEAMAVKPNQEDWISLANAEVGHQGFLKATLKVESAEEGRFIGATKTKAVIIQGVDTSGLVTGRWVTLPQRLKVVGTENASNGATLFVLEPIDAAQNVVARAEDPALSAPTSRPLIINDVRQR
jgi:hypothetical protein